MTDPYETVEDYINRTEVVEEDDDFYEDDEPVEDVIAAFERGEKHLTGDEHFDQVLDEFISNNDEALRRLKD